LLFFYQKNEKLKSVSAELYEFLLFLGVELINVAKEHSMRIQLEKAIMGINIRAECYIPAVLPT